MELEPIVGAAPRTRTVACAASGRFAGWRPLLREEVLRQLKAKGT